eukprot:gene577-2551_t
MWRHLLSQLAAGVAQTQANNECHTMAQAWINSTTPGMPAEPVGDAVAIAE